jgi:hypothetical protein
VYPPEARACSAVALQEVRKNRETRKKKARREWQAGVGVAAGREEGMKQGSGSGMGGSGLCGRLGGCAAMIP